MALHEQINVLQKVIYDDDLTRKALDTNQMLWVSGLLRGSAIEIQLTLSAQCKARPTLTRWFPRAGSAHLWDQTERMKFVLGAADEFDRLLNSAQYRPALERSIREIADGKGVI